MDRWDGREPHEPQAAPSLLHRRELTTNSQVLPGPQGLQGNEVSLAQRERPRGQTNEDAMGQRGEMGLRQHCLPRDRAQPRIVRRRSVVPQDSSKSSFALPSHQRATDYRHRP